MSNDLMLNDNGPMQLPAHLANINFGVTTDLVQGMYTGGNRIGLKGSRFRLVVNGIEEGVIPEPYLDVIILGAAPAVSRVYYGGKYVPGENSAPDCYSADGVVPADDVKNKQSDKCATCPQNVKGSKIVDGQKFKACSYFRRIAVMLAGDVQDRRVFRMDVKAQGLFGEGTVQEKNLNDYIKMVSTRGIDAGALVTRISFDLNSSVPKLLFKAVRFITEDEMEAVTALVSSDEVITAKTVSMSTIDHSTEEPTSGDDEPPAPQAATPAPQHAQAAPAPQRPQQAAPAPQRPQQAAPAPQRPQQVQRPQQATHAVQDSVPIPGKAQTTAAKPAVQEVATNEELDSILASLE